MYDATQEHKPFQYESKSKGHPNKGLINKHPVSGKFSRKIYGKVQDETSKGMSAL